MAEELGAAVLRVTVDTRLATQALEAFRTQVSQQLGGIGKLDLGKADFSGFIQQAAQAGQQAGKAITAGIEAASKKTKELKFRSFQQALDFSPKNTIKGLQEYATALQKLRDQSSLSAAGTQQLTDRLGAIQAALDRARSTTAQATATQRDFNASLEKTRLKRIAEETKQQEAALKGFAASQREAAAANAAAAASSRAAAKAAEEQRKAYLDLARASIGAVGGVASGAVGAASALGKGAVGAIRTGAKVGRAAYGIGAELGIFEDPKPGVINAAIQSVTDKFAFLGKQAQTTRGLILRTLEGVGTGAGLIELARNADLLRESLRAVSVTAKATDASVSAFAKFGNYFANSGLGSIGPLKNLFKGFADLETGTAAITSFTDQLIQIGTKGLSGSVDAIDALVTGFSQLPPAAQAAALAAPAVFAVISGPVGKQAEAQLNKLRSLLEGVGTTSLKVEGQLRDALNAIAREEGILKRAPLALPSSEILQQRLRDSGSRQPQRLEPGVLNAVNNAGLGIAEQYTRQLEAGARAVKSQRDQYIAVQAEASKLLETDLRRQQILNSIARQRASGSGFGAASADNFGVVDPVQKAIRRNQEKTAASEERAQRQRDLFNQDLADVQQRRLAAQKALLQLEEAEKAAAAKRAQAALKQLQDTAATIQRRQQAGADRQAQLRADDFERRLAAVQERNRAQADRRKRLGEAGSNALIGGAFPLLFGQGLGASIGGAAGGGLGGFAGGQLGFGLSLLGTAVGAQFDLASQKAGTLAAALKDPIGKFSELQQAGLLSSKGLERQVEALISTGRAAEAAALIQQDLANTYGRLGNAKALADESDRLGRSWSQLTITLADLVVSPVAGLLKQTSDGLSGFAAAILQVRNVLPGSGNKPSSQGFDFGSAAQEFLLTSALPGGTGPLANLLGVGGRAFGSIAKAFGAGKDKQDSPQVQAAVAAQKELTRLTQQQAVAEASGNRVLAVGIQLISARLKLQQDLAALSEEERKGPKGDQLRQQYNQTAAVTQAQAKAAADAAERELAATRELLGLSGDALTYEQERLRIAEARRQSDKAAADLAKVKADPKADASAIQAAADLAKAQRAEYEKQVQLALNSSTTQLATSERELANTRQLIGLEGERLSIRQEQQRVAQAESEFNSLDAQFRQQYGGVSPNTLTGSELDAYKAAYNFREAAEARLEQTRITALERIRRAEEAIADQRRSVEERISNARAGAGLTGLGRGVLADQSAFRQEQINAARVQQRAKENPGNVQLAEQARDARRSLVAAGEELKLKLQDAFKAAQAAVRNITRSIEDAKLNLAQLRGGTGGVNQFLSPQQVNARAAAVAPELESETKKLAQQLGVIPRFFGSQAQQNEQMAEFIRAARQELRAPEDIAQLNQDLVAANNDLAAVTKALISSNASVQQSMSSLGTQIAELVAKQWNVDVTVTGGAAAIKTF